MTVNEITEAITGAAIEVHRALCPGLLESAYRQCLRHELQLRGLPFVCEQPLPVVYKGLRLDCGYRVDLIVADAVVVELKTVDHLAPVAVTKRPVRHLGSAHTISEQQCL